MKFPFKKEEDHWKTNPIAQLLIFTPASVVSSILIIPCIILALPLNLFPNNIQIVGMRFLLRLQHTISLSFWYFVQEYYLPDVIPIPFNIEVILVLVGVYYGFSKTINELVNEMIISDLKKLKKVKIEDALIKILSSNLLEPEVRNFLSLS